MAKIVKSAFIVLAVAAIAGAATYSFFSDEEKSVGNTFTAGSLDLKVDNKTHYNGCVCNADDKWDCEPWADATVTENQAKRRDGSSVLANRSDLGTALGAAESTGVNPDPTVPTGSFYSLGFGGSVVLRFNNLIVNGGNNDLKVFEITGSTSPPYPEEKIKIEVSKDGTSWSDAVPSIVTRDAEVDLGALDWARYVKLTDATNTADFPLPTPTYVDADGYDLDAVKALHCECVPEELEGQSCENMTWSETDLGPQKFFNFSDVKPGDNGEDTVSLHVYSNDAWGRMKINVTKDSDNTCVDPEKEVDSNCAEPGEGLGELRENLKFIVWLDEGIAPGFQGKNQQGKMIDVGEGDNLKQDNEIQLISAGPVDTPQEIWSVKDAIRASFSAHGASPGITADGHMVASITYYFGIGWVLPEDTGNEVQTDIFKGDITFEVEQYRNNPSPF